MKKLTSYLIGMVILGASVLQMSSCNTDNDPFVEDNLFFVEFVIDGDTIRYEDGEGNYGNGPGVESFKDSFGRNHKQLTLFIRNSFFPNYEDDNLSIQMVKFFSDTVSPSYNTEFLLFDEGQYAFGSWNGDTTNLGTDGVVITYSDSDGKVWSSDQAFGQQQGTETFEITSHLAADVNLFGAKTKGTFNCRLFDGLGGYLDLTNGQFHARTIQKP